jgi:hypothetical protein
LEYHLIGLVKIDKSVYNAHKQSGVNELCAI